jgi:hypothetical protein
VVSRDNLHRHGQQELLVAKKTVNIAPTNVLILGLAEADQGTQVEVDQLLLDEWAAVILRMDAVQTAFAHAVRMAS